MMFDEIKLKSDGIALLRDEIVLGSKLTGRRV